MDDRDRIAWLYRRVGFGPAAGQLDELESAGVAAAIDRLVDPAAHGVPAAPDPWAGIEYPVYDPEDPANRERAIRTIASWIVAFATTPRPLEEWMRWFWHGHFVSTLRVVQDPLLMVQQLRTFQQFGMGDFRSLLAAVTIDPAMLIYLDGVTNTKNAVNENFGREVLELFALGIGNYTEADVRAGAEALTGWRVDRKGRRAVFDPRRHDDRPKRYLGATGVRDVDTVVDAIVAHPACARFVTHELAHAILGPGVDAAVIDRLAEDFATSGLEIRPLVRAILEAGVDGGASRDLVVGPVPWLVATLKATGAPPEATLRTIGPRGLVPAGQVPMDAPNVAGFPSGPAWLSSSTTVARFNMAGAIATATPAGAAVRAAAAASDPDRLADLFGRPSGFGDATRAALARARGADGDGTAALTIAMASPELVIA